MSPRHRPGAVDEKEKNCRNACAICIKCHQTHSIIDFGIYFVAIDEFQKGKLTTESDKRDRKGDENRKVINIRVAPVEYRLLVIVCWHLEYTVHVTSGAWLDNTHA